MVTDEQIAELSSMIKEIYGYIFSDRFKPNRAEVRMTPTELRDILDIPHNTYYVWVKKGKLPRRRDKDGYYFIASEIDKLITDKRIIREDRYVREFRRNYIFNAE